MHRFVLSLVLLGTSFVVASADPVLSVIDNGMVGANRQWLVEVAPDPNLFNNGEGSLEVELAFEVTGSELVGATYNSTDWTFVNPGLNPFEGGTTFGLQTDLDDDTVFASLGSDLFNSGDLVEVLMIETMGSGNTTLSWGGHTLLAGTSFEYITSRIAQDGTKFDGYQGSLTAGTSLAGDYDGSGLVAAGDLNLVLNNWGQDGTTPPTGWVNDFPDGIISAGELNGVLSAWGDSAVTSVPEPGALCLLSLGAMLVGRFRR